MAALAHRPAFETNALSFGLPPKRGMQLAVPSKGTPKHHTKRALRVAWFDHMVVVVGWGASAACAALPMFMVVSI